MRRYSDPWAASCGNDYALRHQCFTGPYFGHKARGLWRKQVDRILHCVGASAVFVDHAPWDSRVNIGGETDRRTPKEKPGQKKVGVLSGRTSSSPLTMRQSEPDVLSASGVQK